MKQVIKWLDGKKTAIGGTTSLVIAWALALNYIDVPTAKMLLGVSTIWTTVGLGHKSVKRKRRKRK